ncbi:hypothetical protein PR048_007112 [Dryococelus australis]|uniref:Calponin-homology (CH) domain-containing protein n=1 Tax=Dryococelus australis TaxID=614101 RepID=A0ABQ9IEW3_9NEOP|nr:hypothetical protein PR048_007112 [Dryococelus australis]
MGEIVKNWLFQKTGILPNLREKDFGIIITDGSVLAKLLQSYGVLASDVAEAIKPSDDLAIKVNNLRLLQAPLNFIGIKIDNTEVEELALGTGTTALKLIYEIFLKLEGGEKFHFAGQVKENEKKISELHVSIKSDPPCPKFQKNPLVKKINEKINPVEWHKTRYEELNKRCKEAREYAREALRKIILHDDPCSLSDTSKRTEKENIEKELSDAKKSMKNFSQKYDVNGKELSFQDLIHMKETSEKYTPMIESKVKAKELLNLMRQRSKREAASQAFRQSMRALLLTRIWDHLLEQNEKVFDEAVLQKLLRQSRYEKQIATKLFQVRHEQKTIAQNRIRRNKLILDRRHTELTLDYLRKDAEMESEVYELNLENRRKLEHHRRLYEVKIRRKHEKHYSLCQEILSAFVDISIKSSEYQRHAGYEVPTALWNEWKVSFLKGLPIFEGIVNLEIMLNEKFQELPDPIIMLEVERNEALVDQEFKDYMALSGLWSLDNLNHELNRFEENLEILGFVIHTLLSAKYPKPVPKKPAVLPTAKVAAVVVDIADDRTTNALQKLLNNRGIVVVRLNNVLAESIGTYHREILNRRDFEVEMTSDLNIALNDSTRIYTVNGNKENSTEFQSVRQEVNGTTDEDEVHVTFKDKVTQTPRRVPCDDETSYPSKMAELGKHIYEILLQGQHIPDSLLIDSVIEYLRENTTEDGWLLVNFPNTYQQADLFEESLTGQRLPPLSHQTQTTEEFIVNVGNRESPEEHICLAQSSLLPNPIPEPREEPFRTYFTVYVNMKKTEEDSEEFQIAFSSESTPLEKFYWNQGINYSFYYKTFNFDIVKYLAKVVIGDSEIRLKTSEELFGPVLEEVANQLNPPKTQENTSKRTRREDSNKTENQSAKKTRSVQIPNTEEKHPNVQKKQSRVKENGNTTTKNGELEPDKDKKRKRDDKKDTVNNDKSSNKRNGGINTTDDIQVKDIETLNHREVLTQALKPEQTEHPEKTHRFVELDIPAEFQVILATVWEAVEKVYIETLKQVFFLMRLHRSTIVPYEKCVRDSFSEIIKRPSEKQQAVSDFQSKFNDISGELREFTDMKNELHCRVQELESLLLDMCDERKKGVEAERRRVAGQSWVAGEMAALADVFAAAARAEAERAVSTLQLLADYYLAGLRRAPLSPRLRGEGAPPAHTTHLCMRPQWTIRVCNPDTPVDDARSLRNRFVASCETIRNLPRIHQRIRVSMQWRADACRNADITRYLQPYLVLVQASTRPGARAGIPAAITGERRRSRSGHSDAAAAAAVTRWLVEVSAAPVEPPLHPNSAFAAADAAAATLHDVAATLHDVVARERRDVANKMGTDKKKKPKKKAKQQASEDMEDEATAAFLQLSSRIFEEWEEAIACEVNRATFRLNLLRSKARKDLAEFLTGMRKLFQDIHEEIAQRYEREVSAVEALCEVLRAAIEEETPVQQQLVLEQDRFVARRDVLLFPSPPPPAAPLPDEPTTSTAFRVDQLQWLAKTFRNSKSQSVVLVAEHSSAVPVKEINGVHCPNLRTSVVTAGSVAFNPDAKTTLVSDSSAASVNKGTLSQLFLPLVTALAACFASRFTSFDRCRSYSYTRQLLLGPESCPTIYSHLALTWKVRRTPSLAERSERLASRRGKAGTVIFTLTPAAAAPLSVIMSEARHPRRREGAYTPPVRPRHLPLVHHKLTPWSRGGGGG